MKELKLTSDSPTWLYIYRITDELDNLGKIIIPKYAYLPFDFWICFRCLSDDSGWKSKRRYLKEDNAILLDIVTFDSEFEDIKGDKNAQRKVMGKTFYPFFVETLNKYKRTFPLLNENKDSLQEDVKKWLIDNRWLDVPY